MNQKIFTKIQQILKQCPQAIKQPLVLKNLVKSTFGVDIDPHYSSITECVFDIDRLIMENYFAKVWQPQTKKYKYSGLGIIDEINSLNPRNVLDLGCGYNEFKGKINNLIGVDPYNDRADIKADIMSFQTEEKFDVVISLGSINFGSVDKIILEMIQASNLTADGGLMFFRVNPGKMHDKPEAKWIDFFEWTPEFISNLAPILGTTVVTIKQDGERLFFLLRKNNN